MPLISMYTFSLLLAVGSIALAAAVIVSAVLFYSHRPTRARLKAISYTTYIKIIAAIAIGSTAGALIYQFVYETPICVLCWWQRIFMFPIGVIAVIALKYNERAAHISTAILAAFGTAFAAYHYYGHFQIYVQDKTDIVMTCDAFGGAGLPSCAATPFELFGFVTIPFMALAGFIALLWLCFLAHKAQK